MTILFIEYNLEETHKSWEFFKENHMVKISYKGKEGYTESFWVWISKINKETINGIICNDLITEDLFVGKKIKFCKKHIKELSNRNYTLEQTLASIKFTKNNILAKLIEQANMVITKN